ncbi:MAG TPA: ATP-binding protein [Verrucomicrobiae bacterium]|nr:ATP-binding protein [Verrucomicrobiae bacterium]
MNRPKNKANDSEIPATPEAKGRVGLWLQPTGSRAVVLSFIILALIVLITLLVYETGGTRFAWLHLMYLPIILAAAVFGIYGGVGAALAAGLALGPYMPMNVSTGLPQTPSNWLFRIGFYLLAGAFSGLISNFLNGQINRLKETHYRLWLAHEELKSAQMKLIQTAKLESVGRLAAGVAHEVKNPLAIIQLGIDYLTRVWKDTASRDCLETVREMGDATGRADAVIKGLLDFSRSEPLSLVPQDLNPVIEESLLLVKHELTQHHVLLEKNLAAQLPRVALDRNKLKQVFINVFMNAIQAMGDSGTLSVKTLVTAEETGAAGQRVVIQTEDTGSGIPEDKLDKLFEPFFTTKPAGFGTGLGLSVSGKIIELHRGTISIANRTGIRGAVVTITLPVPDGS